jgi:hypothetical protein
MNKMLLAVAICAAVVSRTASAQGLNALRPNHQPASLSFVFRDGAGKINSAEVIQRYQPRKIARPFSKIGSRMDPKLMRAATIAEERAHAHSQRLCWHAVKEALLASGAVDSRPRTILAKEAAWELVSSYGFKRLPVTDPYQAPVGSILVYDASRAAGHIEIRTEDGFVSDFRSKTPSKRPLLGVFVKS